VTAVCAVTKAWIETNRRFHIAFKPMQTKHSKSVFWTPTMYVSPCIVNAKRRKYSTLMLNVSVGRIRCHFRMSRIIDGECHKDLLGPFLLPQTSSRTDHCALNKFPTIMNTALSLQPLHRICNLFMCLYYRLLIALVQTYASVSLLLASSLSLAIYALAHIPHLVKPSHSWPLANRL